MSMDRLLLIICALPILIGCDTRQTGAGSNTATNQSQDLPLPKTRHEFAKAMSTVQESMSETEVLAILGKPDDIWTRYDPGGISAYRTKEIWRYGTDGHLTTATLGQVSIDMEGRAQYVYGGRGEPPSVSMFHEEELRELLRIIDRIPSYEPGWNYDPLRLIQAVNSLQRLGKEKALAAISEYVRVSSYLFDEARHGVFLVLRLLFEVPGNPGYMPQMLVGGPEPSEPGDLKLLPRFPVALQDDIPFLIVHWYVMVGTRQPVEPHLEYFRKDGKLRTRPLCPTSKPFEALDKVINSLGSAYSTNQYWDRGRIRNMLNNQLLWLVRTVYDVEAVRWGRFGDTRLSAEGRLKRVAAEVSKLKIRWDDQKNLFTFEDGSYFADEVED